MTTITLTPAELCTTLAALRYWQRHGLFSYGHEQAIASEEGDRLEASEIDALCERINTGEEPPAVALLTEALAYEADCWGEDDEIDGGDLVEWFAEWRQRAKAVVGKVV